MRPGLTQAEPATWEKVGRVKWARGERRSVIAFSNAFGAYVDQTHIGDFPTVEDAQRAADTASRPRDDGALADVQHWSRQIHGSGARHDWCMATARAILAGTPLPNWRGYSRRARSTADSRRTTINRLLGLGERTDWTGSEEP